MKTYKVGDITYHRQLYEVTVEKTDNGLISFDITDKRHNSIYGAILKNNQENLFGVQLNETGEKNRQRVEKLTKKIAENFFELFDLIEEEEEEEKEEIEF